MLEVFPRYLKICQQHCIINVCKPAFLNDNHPKAKSYLLYMQAPTQLQTRSLCLTTSTPTSIIAEKDKSAPEYVSRARLLDFWQHSDRALEAEFETGKAVLMVDKEPLVEYVQPNSSNTQIQGYKLVTFDCVELRKKVNLYGLEIGVLNSALLDIVPDEYKNRESIYSGLFGCALRLMPPPEESKISIQSIRKDLGNVLGGTFVSLRYAMLTMADEYDRNLLAKFQALTRWYKIYRRCPHCGNALFMRASKSVATCISCDLVFYPTISPVAIVIVRDPTNKHCLLVQHKKRVGSVFTAISGFCSTGESLRQTVKREVAEEVGIECYDIKPLNLSQPWPMPDNSLMCAFTATANMADRLDLAPDEIEYAQWFSRVEVAEAVQRVDADPLLHLSHLRKVEDLKARHTLKYIPPKGAIAYNIIKNWVNDTGATT